MIATSLREGSLLYGLGGLAVRSPFTIRSLHASAGEGDGQADIAVSLEHGPGPSGGQRLFRWPGRYGLSLWRTGGAWQFASFQDGSFVVSNDGGTIRCFYADPDSRSPDGSAPAGLQHVLSRRVLPRVGMLHGRVGLHAASVSDGQTAILIVGAAHAGKSTLSAAAHQLLGWRVLADDISLIATSQHSVCCFRVGAGTCLRADTLAALHSSKGASLPIPHQTEKRWCAADTESGPTVAPVRAIVFLGPEQRDRIQLSRISPSHALVNATACQVLFNPADLKARGAVMNSLARVAEKVPAYEFSYPRRFDWLPDVTARLRELLSQGIA